MDGRIGLAGEHGPATDRIKDVWILRSVPATSMSVHAQAEEAPKRLRLTSRVAESFFWMGRYAERAEVTTRMLRIVQMQAWPLTDSATARQRRPLWAAMARISGHSADFFVKPGRDAITARQVPFYFLLDKRTADRSFPTCWRAGRTRRISGSIFRRKSGRC